MHGLLHFLGLDSASGTAYLAWSGCGSDAAELALIGALYAWIRKHNCSVGRCWRLGRHVTAAQHWVCARHHPDGAPTHAEVIAAHHAARTRNRLAKTLVRERDTGAATRKETP